MPRSDGPPSPPSLPLSRESRRYREREIIGLQIAHVWSRIRLENSVPNFDVAIWRVWQCTAAVLDVVIAGPVQDAYSTLILRHCFLHQRFQLCCILELGPLCRIHLLPPQAQRPQVCPGHSPARLASRLERWLQPSTPCKFVEPAVRDLCRACPEDEALPADETEPHHRADHALLGSA